jgi:hypothetical protein
LILTVYTAVTRGYDHLAMAPRGVRCVAFVEDCGVDANGWELHPLIGESPDPVRRAKRYKVLPWQVLPAETDCSIWLDGSVLCRPHVNLAALAARCLATSDFVARRHPSRDCIYSEAEEIVSCRLDDPELVRAQMGRYRNARYPNRNGLAETGILLRRHSDEVKRHAAVWWDEIERGSRRDQLSFDYSCREARLQYTVLSPWEASGLVIRPHARTKAPAAPTETIIDYIYGRNRR